jgi:hypothetical protein
MWMHYKMMLCDNTNLMLYKNMLYMYKYLSTQYLYSLLQKSIPDCY